MSSRALASADAYPHLRQCLAPEFAELDAASLEAYMDERFGEGAAEQYDEYLEGFFDDVGRAFRKVAPVVANVAGGVARGAMSGSSLGLPGIIGGAVVGGAGTALSSYAKGPLRDVGNVLNTGTQIASQFSPMGRLGNQVGTMVSGLGQGRITPQRLLLQGSQVLGAVGGGNPAMAGVGRLLGAAGGMAGAGGGGGAGGMAGAAGLLSGMLGRPEVQQALMAMNLGPAGRRTVPVGAARTPVPTTAIAGLLQNLTAQAIDEAAAFDEGAESALGYMADANGEFVGDPGEELDRSARVMDLLNNAHFERLASAALADWPAIAQAASQAVGQARAQMQQRQPPRPRRPDWQPPAAEDNVYEFFDEYAGVDEGAEAAGYDEQAEDAGYGAAYGAEYDGEFDGEFDAEQDGAYEAAYDESDGAYDGEAWDESAESAEAAGEDFQEWDEEIQYVYA
ncbi:hypothetical protein [Roseateles aquatilis]|nr:hypothetical protein [Roseateles aquatilis]